MIHRVHQLLVGANVGRISRPYFSKQSDRGNSYVVCVGGILVSILQALLQYELQQISIGQVVRVFLGQVRKYCVEGVEVLDGVGVEALQRIHIHPTNLVASAGEVADAGNKVLSKLRVLFKGIVDGINAVVFALKPLHQQLSKRIVSCKICGDAGNGSKTQLCNVNIITIAPARYGLQHLLKVLMGRFYYFGVGARHRIINLHLKHHGQMPAVLEHLLVPIDHWLKPALHAFDHAMNQKLIVISQKSSCLLWFHSKSST